ncbi:MAG: cyclase family protein [Acidimicrobiales bacterium]
MPDHEAGRLAQLRPADRLRALGAVRDGKVFTLGIELFGPTPVPGYPGSPTPLHLMYQDWSHYEKGLLHPDAGNVAWVDDGVLLNCHGGTHLDALGHVVVDGTIAGGIAASSTVGGLAHADVAAIARLGVLCRGVLVDLCRGNGGAPLPRDHQVSLEEIESCLRDEKVEIASRDMLLLRTGSLERYREEGAAAFFADYSEPGLSYDEELFKWVDTHELLGVGSDTLAHELPRDPATQEEFCLHHHLLCDRGLQFHEVLWLAELAADCAADGRYAGLYMASPLKLVGASGCPVNPLFVK